MHAAAKLLMLLEVIAIGQFEGCDMRTVTGGCPAEALQRGGDGTSLDSARSKGNGYKCYHKNESSLSIKAQFGLCWRRQRIHHA